MAFVHDEMNLQFGPCGEQKNVAREATSNKVRSSNLAAKVDDDSKALPNSPLKDGAHKIWICSKFKSQSVTERYETVKKLKLCFCCLDGTHPIKDCKSNRTCGVKGCTKKHNRLLHFESKKQDKTQTESSDTVAASNNLAANESVGMLQLVNIMVSNPDTTT